MVRHKGARGSSGPLSPSKKHGPRVVSEDEVFSPESLPIDDPPEEKKVIEGRKIPYGLYLAGKTVTGSLGWTEECVNNRIREGYRRCFESTGKEDMKVIRDFVAFHPGLVFETPWLAALVREHTIFGEPRKGSYRERLLRALQNGFKGAAGSAPIRKRWRAGRVEGQKFLMNAFEGQIRQAYKENEWNLNIPEWQKSEVPRKVDELVNQYPILKDVSDDLKEHLRKRQFRLAARLIVNMLWGVDKRTLDGKSNR
jgi:hypothetical protein